MTKNIARDIIAVVIVIGAMVSLFINVTEIGADLVRFLSGVVIGFYFNPVSTTLKAKFKKTPTVPTPEE